MDGRRYRRPTEDEAKVLNQELVRRHMLVSKVIHRHSGAQSVFHKERQIARAWNAYHAWKVEQGVWAANGSYNIIWVCIK